MSKINFFALGGIDENGKNSFVLEIDDDIFLIDVGVKKPIISRLGIDTIIPSFKYLVNNSSKIKGVFISHIHDENFAALPWLLKDVPNLKIYASKFSIKVIEDRLSKYNISKDTYSLIEFNAPLIINKRKITPLPLAHSIPGTLGFCFETNDGPIVYISDYILNHPFQEFGITNLDIIKQAVGDRSLLLITDCSNANKDGFASDKATISNLIYPYMEKVPKNSRIIIGAFDEEMTAIHEILLIAKNLNRVVAFYGREYSELFNFFRQENPNFVPPQIIPYQRANFSENVIVIVSGKGDRLYQRFFRIIENDDVYLKLRPTDHTLMIMPPINGHEKMYTKVLDDVMRITNHIMEVSATQFNKFQPRYNDLKTIFQLVKPRYLIPIRGLHRYLYSSVLRLAKENLIQEGYCFLLKNGRKLILENGKFVSLNTKILEVMDIAIDGLDSGDVPETVILEREQLSANGVLLISIYYDPKKIILKEKIGITNYGIFAFQENDKFYENIEKIVRESFAKYQEAQKIDGRDFQSTVRRRLQKVIMKTMNKKPIIVPVLYEC